jgi:hypothetical protein
VAEERTHSQRFVTALRLSTPILRIRQPHGRESRWPLLPLWQNGFGDMLTFVTQQIEPFRLEGERFAMQHIRTDEELEKVWRGLLRSVPWKSDWMGWRPNSSWKR